MKSKYLLFGFAILVCLSGIGYLATNYFQYLSGIEKLVFVLLWAGMFAFLGKYCGLWGKAWMPRATGILSLIASALPLIVLAVFFLSSGSFGPGVMTFIYFAVPLFLFALSVGFAAKAMGLYPIQMLASLVMPLLLIGMLVAVAGGTCALKKKYWGLTLAGAIGAFICSPLVGIPAIILAAQAKAAFSSNGSRNIDLTDGKD